MSGAAVDRRSVLRTMLHGALLFSILRLGTRRRATGASAHRPAGTPPSLSPAQQRLAERGAIREAADPDAADRLAQFAAVDTAHLGVDVRRRDAADRLCAVLLAAPRVRKEFRVGDLVRASRP